MKKKAKIRLKKKGTVKVRRTWSRSPTLRVKGSGKVYRRKSGNAILKELDDTQGC